jgi:type IV secretory pathway TraG/TraD family ATPase VirD4
MRSLRLSRPLEAPTPTDLAATSPTYRFAGINHQLEWAKFTFLVIGAPRSGKTLLLFILARSALDTICSGHTKRAFFFDAKREYWPWLRRLLGPEQVKLIDPFNLDGVAWDIAADVRSVDDAEAMGRLLAPVRVDAREPFFEEVVGALFAGVLVSLHITREGRWVLGDVVDVMESPDSILKTLRLAPELNRFRIETYFKAKTQNRDVLATLGNRIQALQVAARRWERAKETVTVSDWMKGCFVLVLGHSHQQAEATAAIVRAFFYRLTRVLLDSPDTDYPQSWIFLDELPTPGKLDGLHDLLSKGPSRGVVPVLGFQDIGSMRYIYGPDLTQAFNAFAAHKAFLRIDDPDTAEWASRHFGEHYLKVPLWNHSRTSGAQASSTISVGEHLLKVRVVPPEMFMDIPPLLPPMTTSLGAYVISPLGKYPYQLDLETIQRLFPRLKSGDMGTSLPQIVLPSPEIPPDDLPYL